MRTIFLFGLALVAAVAVGACAAEPASSVTFRIEVLGSRAAVETADLVLTPTHTRGGEIKFSGGRFLRRYEFDWPLANLLTGVPVTVRSHRAGVLVDSQVLAPFVCGEGALVPPNIAGLRVVEAHQLEVDAEGQLFVDYDTERPLYYSCDVSRIDEAEGEAVIGFEASTPTCSDLPGFDTNVLVEVGGVAFEPATCRARQSEGGGVNVLAVDFMASTPEGKTLAVTFAVCAWPADVPLERSVESVRGTPCAREGFQAVLSDEAMTMELAGSGSLRLDAIQDSRDGWLEGEIDVVLRGEGDELFAVAGPFRLGTLRR